MTLYPKTDFRMPLDIPPSLSGSFGEIRPGHFHSGSDFRTNQREGYPVYAVSDGYVSRLRVQIGGFGNAVYLNHPNGYTTVYAHLQRFNAQIERTLLAYQHRTKSYGVDIPMLPIEIPVKKGDIIAWSGNTGGSAGPHLHFEVRDSKTEETVNPELFGIHVPDNIRPTIAGLYMYRLNGKPFDENTVRQYFALVKSGSRYTLNKMPIINFSGDVGFGINTYDVQAAGNKNGIYSIELQMDGQTIYHAEMERFSFANSRAVNSHMDYPFRMKSGTVVTKSFVEPGNPLKIYKTLVNNGLVSLTDDQIHDMKYIVKDVSGNTSTLDFRIRYNPKSVIKGDEPKYVQLFNYNKENTYSTANMKIKIPKGALYNDLYFRYSEGDKSGYSAVHRVHTSLIPLHSNYELSIRADSTLPAHLHKYAVIVDARGAYQGGTYENGFVKANPRVFGNFRITVDTVAPAITSLNLKDGMSVAGLSKLNFKISDNLSGIRSFNATIDGQWVLMEYDPKRALTWHTLDKALPKGKHHFQYVVIDMKGNSKTFNATFYK
ncbi:M23 family metallopeptidase [Arcticibacter sp.]|uniref:M23 family metallopeptidase n=1 Tax=Arcticibacter sp. TaxID=1872630 RepID=UPI00388D76F6